MIIKSWKIDKLSLVSSKLPIWTIENLISTSSGSSWSKRVNYELSSRNKVICSHKNVFAFIDLIGREDMKQ